MQGFFRFTLLIALWASISVTQAAKITGPKIYTNIDEYNDAHTNQALKFWINDTPQIEGTCVCHTLLTIHAALTGKRDYISPARMKSGACNNAIFFDNYYTFQKNHPGFLSGTLALMYGEFPISADDAISLIVESLDYGKVAAVSLNARPMYDDYSSKTGLTIISDGLFAKSTSWPIRHAIILIGLQRDKAGKVVKFYVADSSGPQRKYSISLDSFRDSYSSIHALPSRAVYIPDKSINPSIRYLPR